MSLPIIMVSGSPGAEEEARLAGATEFLHKSANMKQVERRVKSLLPP